MKIKKKHSYFANTGEELYYFSGTTRLCCRFSFVQFYMHYVMGQEEYIPFVSLPNKKLLKEYLKKHKRMHEAEE